MSKSKYETGVVTFLDILGFRDLVTNESAEVVNSKLQALEISTQPSLPIPQGDPEDYYEPLVLQFSDAIVRVRRTTSEANQKYQIGLVFQELLSLVHAQGELIQKGIFLRGGIAYGPIYASKNRIFGPALVDAYELESKFAKYPRIVIQPTLIEELRKNKLLKAIHHSHTDEIKYISKLIRRGDDGIWFVDYIRAIESEFDDIGMYSIFLKLHRQKILDGAKHFAGLNDPLSKYLWLATYHNECISQIKKTWFKHYGVRKKDLLISSSDMNVLQDLSPLRKKRKPKSVKLMT